MHRRILAPVAAAVLAFGLVACGDTGGGTVTTPPPSIDIGGGSDDGGAEPSDGGSGASDGGGDSPVAAPDIPAPDPADYPGMDQNTPEGAEQAFRYYIAVSMWSHQTGDSEILESLESGDCTGCKELNEDLPDLQEANRYWGEVEIRDVEIVSITGENFDYEVGYLFTLGAHTEPDLESEDDDQVNETEYDAIGGMTWTEGRWLVYGIKAEWGPDVHD